MKQPAIKRSIFLLLIITPFLLFAIINKRNIIYHANSNETTLKAEIKDAPKPLPVYGFNGNNCLGPAWTDNAFRDSAASLQFKIIRYPGGSLGEWWDWRKGWFIDDDDQLKSIGLTLPAIDKKFKYSPTGLNELKLLVDQTHCDVVFDLNMVTRDLNDQIEMLKTAESLGIGVKWVELGNEYNLRLGPGRIKYPSSDAYGIASQVWTSTIKETFPGVKVAIVGGNLPYAPDAKDWNNIVLNKAPDVDAIVAHIYTAPAKVVDDNGINFENLYNEFKENFDKAGFNNVNKPVWITESNIQWAIVPPGDAGKAMQKFSTSWGQALAAVLMASVATNLTNPSPQLFLDQNIANWVAFAAVQGRSTGVRILPNGIGFGMWCKACHNKTSLTQISFKRVRKGYEDDYAVLGWQFKGNNEETDLFVNFTSDPVTIDGSTININDNLFYDLKYADKNKSFEVYSDINSERKKVTNNSIQLPPYSIALVTK